MTPGDLDAVVAMAAVCYPDHPEDRAVFAERLALFPQGCLVLDGGDGPEGYVLSYPWHADAAPALNALVGAMPPDAETYYLHDLAILPSGRGQGHPRSALAWLSDGPAREFPAISLVSVNGTVPFWQAHGFELRDPPGMAAKLASYGADARFLVRPA